MAIAEPLAMGCAQKGQVSANSANVPRFAGFAVVVVVALFRLRARVWLPALLWPRALRGARGMFAL
jgi:hypothetical protein